MHQIYFCIFLFVLTVSVITDMQTRMIPVGVVLFFGGIIILIQLGEQHFSAAQIIVAGIITFVTCLFSYCSREQIGMGDGFLFGLCCMSLGIAQCTATLFVTFFLAGIFGIFSLCLKKMDRNTEFPLSPFIMISTILVEGVF